MRRFIGFIVFLALSGMSFLSAEGGEGGVEAALVTYTDAKAGFSIGHPGTWSKDPAFAQGLRFAGGDDAMTVTILALPEGSDLHAFADKDAPALAKDFPGFRQLYLRASKDIKGAWVLGFEAQGASAVTGKAFKAHDERYYIPLKGSRIGLVTVTGPANHYDLEGVRDIAITLAVR